MPAGPERKVGLGCAAPSPAPGANARRGFLRRVPSPCPRSAPSARAPTTPARFPPPILPIPPPPTGGRAGTPVQRRLPAASVWSRGCRRVRYRSTPPRSQAQPLLTCRYQRRRGDALAAVWLRTPGPQRPSPRDTPPGPRPRPRALGPAHRLADSPPSACEAGLRGSGARSARPLGNATVR